MRVRLDDGTACFNLNAWSRAHRPVVATRGRARQYRALLRALEFSPTQAAAMSDALVDWIDADHVPGPAGAEDAAYAARGTGERTSGALLAEVSELRAISGHDAAAYARLRPHVCALPEATLSPVNLNTLGEADAVVLSMLGDGALAPKPRAE